MGRFTGVDVGVVVLGGVMIVVGAWLVVDPIETVLRHGVAAHRGGGWSSSLAYRVSKSTSRMFGATAVVAGAGLIGVGRMREGPDESPCRK